MQKPANGHSPFSHYDRPRVSFVEGLASILDLGGTLSWGAPAETAAAQWADRLIGQGILNRDALQGGRVVAVTGTKSDTEAIRDYWRTVGQYIRDAVGEEQRAVHQDSRPFIGKGK